MNKSKNSPKLLFERRKNAQTFQSLFKKHPFIQIQKEISSSSWFGFSIVLKENSPISRSDLVAALNKNDIECRPIVTGNFLKNRAVLEYFDYEIHGEMKMQVTSTKMVYLLETTIMI